VLLKKMEQARNVEPSWYAASSKHGSSRRLQQCILQALAEVWEPLQPDSRLIAGLTLAVLPYLHVKTPEDLAVGGIYKH